MNIEILNISTFFLRETIDHKHKKVIKKEKKSAAIRNKRFKATTVAHHGEKQKK